MLLLQYLNEQEKHSVSFKNVSKNIVQISGAFPIKTLGFTLSREGKKDKRNYSANTII